MSRGGASAHWRQLSDTPLEQIEGIDYRSRRSPEWRADDPESRADYFGVLIRAACLDRGRRDHGQDWEEEIMNSEDDHGVARPTAAPCRARPYGEESPGPRAYADSWIVGRPAAAWSRGDGVSTIPSVIGNPSWRDPGPRSAPEVIDTRHELPDGCGRQSGPRRRRRSSSRHAAGRDRRGGSASARRLGDETKSRNDRHETYTDDGRERTFLPGVRGCSPCWRWAVHRGVS